MSRMTFTRIRPHQVRAVSDLESIWDNFEASSQPLDETNFAPEGLDRHAFAATRAAVRLATIRDTTRSALAPAASFTTFVQSLNFRTGALGAIRSQDGIRILSCVYFGSLANDPNPLGLSGALLGGGFALMEMRHHYRENGVNTVVPATTLKKNHGFAGGEFGRNDDTMLIESFIAGPLVNLEWVELQYKLTGTVDNQRPTFSVLLVDKLLSVKVVT